MSEEEPIRHVYILGAGASIPLGGPSFNQLLTDNRLVQRILSFELLAPEIKFVRNVHGCISGLYSFFGMDSGSPDMEQLLERLDYCESAQDPEFVKQAVAHFGLPGPSTISNGIGDINNWIRIRIAIETSSFLSQLPDDSERWEPYKSWFLSLSNSDTVLTFNYDGVVEKTALLVDRPYFTGSDWQVRSLVNPSEGLPALLKLHGSSDWFYRSSVPKEIESVLVEPIDIFDPHKNWADFITQGKQVLLGSPGLSKKRMSSELFKPLWDKASQAIGEAHVISIVGYSMPATDNLAKQLILESIAINKSLKQINIVLGPDSNSPRARRVYELCRQVALAREGAIVSNGVKLTEREKIVRLSSMYSQDFLPLHRPRTLREIDVSNLT